MKIAYYADVFYPELSGIADSMILTGEELARRGHEVHYFVPKYTKREFDMAGLAVGELVTHRKDAVRRGPSFSYPGPTGQGRAYVPCPRNILSGETFDVIHSHTFFGAGIEAYVRARLYGIPFVATNHTFIEAFSAYAPAGIPGMKTMLQKGVLRYYKNISLVSVPSEFLATDMKKFGHTGRLEPISNPVHPNFFVSHDASRDTSKEFTVLNVGRIAEEKNLMEVIEAAPNILKTIPHARFVFVGTGGFRAAMQKRAEELGVARAISFEGPYLEQDKKRVVEAYKKADCFVMPSISETQGMVVLQAMAAEVPVAVSFHGPLPGLVAEGRGKLFDPVDPVSLANAVIEIYNQKEESRRMVERAKQYVAQYSVEHIANVWEGVYASAIANKNV